MGKAENGKNNLHSGHRKRFRDRFLSSPDSFSKHELLELLLFYSLPQKNTNPIAHEILLKYDDIKDVLKADKEDLMAIKGVGENTACFLKLIGKLNSYLAEEEAEDIDFYNTERVTPYLLRVLGKEKYECFCIFYLSDKGRILKRELFTQGKTSSVSVHLPDIHKTCVLLNPSQIVFAHNHPSGDSTPSLADDDSTKSIKELAEFLKIRLCDHVIVGKDKIYSYREEGRII